MRTPDSTPGRWDGARDKGFSFRWSAADPPRASVPWPRRARRRNVLGAFNVPMAELVRGRNILLVDVVLTTGAIVEACARAFKRAGAGKIQILALARVVKSSEASV